MQKGKTVLTLQWIMAISTNNSQIVLNRKYSISYNTGYSKENVTRYWLRGQILEADAEFIIIVIGEEIALLRNDSFVLLPDNVHLVPKTPPK